jgi:hypothetical protein
LLEVLGNDLEDGSGPLCSCENIFDEIQPFNEFNDALYNEEVLLLGVEPFCKGVIFGWLTGIDLKLTDGFKYLFTLCLRNKY